MRRLFAFALALSVALFLPNAAIAQVCSGIPGLTINGGFEEPDVTTTPPTPVQTFGSNPFARLYNENDVPGWSTTANNNRIEIWESGFNSVPSYEGNQHAEVNASAVGALFQDIITQPGSTIIWSFAHRGRAGVDRIRVEMGAAGGSLSNQGTFNTGNTAWAVYSGSYTVPAGQTLTRFQFRAIRTAANSPTIGNFIDAVVIAPLCDYGDAPASFSVLRANNGAAHRISNSAFLGVNVDAEADGQPSALSNGDDNNGTDDEDGVAFGLGGNSQLIRLARNPLEISATAAGYINVWVDLDGDGLWSAGERLVADTAISAGTQTLFFTVPPSASLGTAHARVRYTTDNPAGALGPGGDWGNGEVEDVRLTIIGQAVLVIAKSSAPFADVGAPSSSQFNIPGNDVLYTIDVSNIGEGATDSDSVLVIDRLPPETTFFNGDANGAGAGSDRVLFSAGSTGLTFNANNDVRFSNSVSEPASFAACNYSPVSGYDPAVTFVCFNPKGAMPQGSPSPSFQLQFRARID